MRKRLILNVTNNNWPISTVLCLKKCRNTEGDNTKSFLCLHDNAASHTAKPIHDTSEALSWEVILTTCLYQWITHLLSSTLIRTKMWKNGSTNGSQQKGKDFYWRGILKCITRDGAYFEWSTFYRSSEFNVFCFGKSQHFILVHDFCPLNCWFRSPSNGIETNLSHVNFALYKFPLSITTACVWFCITKTHVLTSKLNKSACGTSHFAGNVAENFTRPDELFCSSKLRCDRTSVLSIG